MGRLPAPCATSDEVFAVLNAMWYELMEDAAIRLDKLDTPVTAQTTR